MEAAHVALPSCGYGEAEGVFVNFEGHAQRARVAVKTRGAADPAWRILRELGRRFGLSAAYPTASAVFDDVAARVPAFAGLSYRALGDRGAMVVGA